MMRSGGEGLFEGERRWEKVGSGPSGRGVYPHPYPGPESHGVLLNFILFQQFN